MTSPACVSTLRCCETAGRDTGSSVFERLARRPLSVGAIADVRLAIANGLDRVKPFPPEALRRAAVRARGSPAGGARARSRSPIQIDSGGVVVFRKEKHDESVQEHHGNQDRSDEGECREASHRSRGSRARHSRDHCRRPACDPCRYVVGPSGEQVLRLRVRTVMSRPNERSVGMIQRTWTWVRHPPVAGPRATMVVRMMAGAVFFWEGILKFVYANQGVGRFTKLGLPFPVFTANFVGGLEIVGGLLLILGLGTRLITIPFIIEMLVAILSTKPRLFLGTLPLPPPPVPPQVGIWAVLPEVRSEYAQIMSCIFLLISGPGPWSLDAALPGFVGANPWSPPIKVTRYPA